ncbi:hypothetical protein ASF53_21335 [Methylobacterium sp. Leaf123]|nr:hypothetical protein ASF53_21335 [Methylobacterium sp. Leaf123]
MNLRDGVTDRLTSIESIQFEAPVCFTTGTLIRTMHGDVPIEELALHDRVVTASGGLRPIVWIGQREVKCTPHTAPVRVLAGAFGPDVPMRDLYLSPGHPVLIGADDDNEGGVLVPVMCLINGTSIVRTLRSKVTYWHIELDTHDILLAEGLLAESYIDGGDRAFFVEASDHALQNPDFVPPGWHNRCRPIMTEGSIVEVERARIGQMFTSLLDRHSCWSEMLPELYAEPYQMR